MYGAALETRDELMVEFMTVMMETERVKNFLDYKGVQRPCGEYASSYTYHRPVVCVVRVVGLEVDDCLVGRRCVVEVVGGNGGRDDV